MATASPQPDSTRPYRSRPLARAASDPRNMQAALAWQMACTRPTRCWSRCSADQSASPVAAAGTVTATPAPISMRAARSVPWNRSSRTAEVQQPSGSRTSAGCAGWPNGTPCSASVLDPAGRARTTPSDSLRMTGSSACACSTRSATAAGLRAQLVLRFLPAWRAVEREGGTSSAYPPAGQLAPSQQDTFVRLPPGRVSLVEASSAVAARHDHRHHLVLPALRPGRGGGLRRGARTLPGARGPPRLRD